MVIPSKVALYLFKNWKCIFHKVIDFFFSRMEHCDFKNEVYQKTAHKWIPVYLVDNVPFLSKKKFGIQTLLIPKTNWYFDLIINNNYHEIEKIKLNSNNLKKRKKKKTTNNTMFNKKRSNSPFFKLR